MSRSYTELECGYLISCDGGGLMPGCDGGLNCKTSEYHKEYDMKYGYCPVCHPIKYKEAVAEEKEWRKNRRVVVVEGVGNQYRINVKHGCEMWRDSFEKMVEELQRVFEVEERDDVNV